MNIYALLTDSFPINIPKNELTNITIHKYSFYSIKSFSNDR